MMCKDTGEMVSGHNYQTYKRVTRLSDKFGADGTVHYVDTERSEGLAFQLTVEVLRQCYKTSHNLQEICMQCSRENGAYKRSVHQNSQREMMDGAERNAEYPA
jgi:hypothetical protein